MKYLKRLFRSSQLLTYLLAFVFIFSGDAYSGELDDFESDIKLPQEEKNREDKTDNNDDKVNDATGSCLGDFFGEIFVESISYLIVAGGAMSMKRISPFAKYDEDEYFKARQSGELLIPYIRVDSSYRDVESDIKANDFQIEGGYGAFGIHYNRSHYKEKAPSDNLDLSYLFALYRMSIASIAEVDFGLGKLTIKGNSKDSRPSFTLPIRIHPNDYLGFELRPAWSSTIKDYDVSFFVGKQYVSLKVGYRWVKGPNESLNGPHIGLSIRL